MQSVGETHAAARGDEQFVELPAQGVEVGRELRYGEEVDLVLGKVDRRFDPDAQAHDALDQRVHALRELAVEAALRGARRGGGTAGDEIGDGLGLGEVELAVEEGAFGEFAGARMARAELDGPCQQQSQHDGAAVRLQFEHVFAGVGTRGGKEQQQAAVDELAGGIAERGVVRVARLRFAAEQGTRDRRRERTGYPQHADATDTGRGRHGGNGVGACVHEARLWRPSSRLPRPAW